MVWKYLWGFSLETGVFQDDILDQSMAASMFHTRCAACQGRTTLASNPFGNVVNGDNSESLAILLLDAALMDFQDDVVMPRV